jgi:hypothetical protein
VASDVMLIGMTVLVRFAVSMLLNLKEPGRLKLSEGIVLLRAAPKVFLYSIDSNVFISGVGYMNIIERIKSQYYQLQIVLLTFRSLLLASYIYFLLYS